MFGSSRRRATQLAVDAVRPLIAIYQYSSGLPARFWHDEYVVGFVGFMIGFHGTMKPGITLSQSDKAQMLGDAFTALSNMNGEKIAQRFDLLALSVPKNVDFEAGADAASACAFASIGKMNAQGQPHYERAKALAEKRHMPKELGSVVSLMVQDLWLDKVKQRFAV